ncbi:MAG: magnesium transporter CorA family protein [Candidatus Nanopelagicales bacterium]
MGSSEVRTRLWRAGHLVSDDFPLAEVSDRLAEDGSLVWVDLCHPDHATLSRLADELGLDQHAVEDAIAVAERPKATSHPNHTFVVTYATHLETGISDEVPANASRLRLTKIAAFVLPRGLVTIRDSDGFDMAEVLSVWDENAELLTLGPGALLHGLLDVVVDGHFDTVQQLDEAIEALEDGLFDEGRLTRATHQQTFRVRKELVELRRVVLPMREVVNAVLRHRSELHREATDLDGWFADLYDHVLRAAEWTESLRDLVTTIFETTLSLQDARLNTIMKKLTGWAAIIAVPTAVTGWFGQNIPYPGFGRPAGVWASTLIILAMAGALYALFRRRDWL